MIGGIVMIFVALWIYQSAMKAKASNVMMWVAIATVTFFVVQLGFIDINLYILEAVRGGEGGSEYERDLTSIGDRKNLGGFQGPKGMFMSVFFELFPPIAGFLLVAFIRTKFVLKEALNKDNLFSGIGDMFKSIKESFKNPE